MKIKAVISHPRFWVWISAFLTAFAFVGTPLLLFDGVLFKKEALPEARAFVRDHKGVFQQSVELGFDARVSLGAASDIPTRISAKMFRTMVQKGFLTDLYLDWWANQLQVLGTYAHDGESVTFVAAFEAAVQLPEFVSRSFHKLDIDGQNAIVTYNITAWRRWVVIFCVVLFVSLVVSWLVVAALFFAAHTVRKVFGQKQTLSAM
jgi:hypothetical protein